MSCTSCYEAILPECPATILVKAGLSADAPYYAVVTTPAGTKYAEAVTTDADGNFEFTADVLPAGSFNRHAGAFTLEVLQELNSCSPESLNICVDGVETAFLCVLFSFVEMSLTTEGEETLEAIIGCDCPEEVI